MQRPLTDRWKAFLSVILDPWIILLLMATASLVWLQVEQSDPALIASLTAVIAVFAGVLGGLLTNRWSQETEERAIAGRGKVAVRGLQLILGNVAALHNRVETYLRRAGDDDLSPEVTRTYLEEIIGKCRVLQEELISSTENWTDIVPEADIKTQIGLVTKLRDTVREDAQRLKELRGQLGDADRSREENLGLRSQIQVKERELALARAKLADKGSDLGPIGRAFGLGSVIDGLVDRDPPIISFGGVTGMDSSNAAMVEFVLDGSVLDRNGDGTAVAGAVVQVTVSDGGLGCPGTLVTEAAAQVTPEGGNDDASGAMVITDVTTEVRANSGDFYRTFAARNLGAGDYTYCFEVVAEDDSVHLTSEARGTQRLLVPESAIWNSNRYINGAQSLCPGCLEGRSPFGF